MGDAITIDTSQVDNWRRRLDGTPAEIDQAMKAATKETATYAERLIVRNARAAGISTRGGSLWLSGVGKSGAPITARAEIAPSGQQFTLRAIGPWHFVEGDTKAHDMPGRRRRKGPYRTPYGFKSKIRHPGTRGKRIWRKSYRDLQQHYPRFYRDKVFNAVSRR
jgi:hypothetical protein